MNNEYFTRLSLEGKRARLENIINIKTGKSLTRGLIASIVANLDLDRQLDVKVVSRDTMQDLCKGGQYVIIDENGLADYVCSIFCKVEYGEVKLGSVLSVTQGGVQTFIKEVPAELNNTPVFMTRVEERVRSTQDGVKLTCKSTLYICL